MSFQFSISELSKLVPESRISGEPDTLITSFCIDTRKIHASDKCIFVALTGPVRDGHDYVRDAYRSGIRLFLVTSPIADLPEATQWIVSDTLEALQAVASWYRKKFSGKVIAVTGSNGKTEVKEWLSILLSADFRIYKSPESYNSQIGVALSLLEMPMEADFAIIEAGISTTGEMERLAALIQPDLGILTHLGDAHDDGFESRESKISEKLKLFRDCKKVWTLSTNEGFPYQGYLDTDKLEFAGNSPEAVIQVESAENHIDYQLISLIAEGVSYTVKLNISGEAARENCLISTLVAHRLGVSWKTIQHQAALLTPVSMRREMITDNPEIIVINDAYNADQLSVMNAFAMLRETSVYPTKKLILTDLETQVSNREEVQKKLLEEAVNTFGAEHIHLIGVFFHSIAEAVPGVHTYHDVGEFLRKFNYHEFAGSVTMLKGARRYQLEQIVPYLTRSVNTSFFKVNLNALENNYRFFRHQIPSSVKIMAMVKAFAYGSGTWEIASLLEDAGANYFAVAYLSEGIALRNKGIRLPIMIMNPEPSGLSQAIEFDLEPEVSSWSLLYQVSSLALLQEKKVRIHLKVDTGMGRLGFESEEGQLLVEYLSGHPELVVMSVLSHLAAADDDTSDDFSLLQIDRFSSFASTLETGLNKELVKHILNTAGILRFPPYAFDMVRLGIGLYGISPLPERIPQLEEIGSLVSRISQIHHYKAGESIGYARSQFTQRASRIATIPIGYADGVPRKLGNGTISFLVNGKKAPTFGRVCMDMLMLDVTDIPEANQGDEVVLIGKQGEETISIVEFADKCETIPYEVLTGISQRVRRVYIRE